MGRGPPVGTRRRTPRELDEDEYAKLVRDIDYPAVRQNPHIMDSRRGGVVESVRGREAFTHVDLMVVDDPAN